MSTNPNIAALEAELLTPEVLGALLSFLLSLISSSTSSAMIDNIITQIQGFLPAIIKLAPQLVAQVKQLIADIENKADLTDDQIQAATLIKKALDTQTDLDIAAAAAYANS